MASFKRCISTLVSLSRTHVRPEFLSSKLIRRCNIRHYSAAYEGDGKTHAVLLNDDNQGLMINSYSQLGFSLNNGVKVLGPIAIFPNCVLSWNVGDISQMNEESLRLFFMLEPKLDILILGVPQYNKTNRSAVNYLIQLVRKYKIQVEVMASEVACPTFNFLHAEQRFVAAGIIPPTDIHGSDAEAMTGAPRVGYVNKSEM